MIERCGASQQFYLHEVITEKKGNTLIKTPANPPEEMRRYAYPSIMSLLKKIQEVKAEIEGVPQYSFSNETDSKISFI